MGAFNKQKNDIKRDLKRQKTDLTKARKLAQALFDQLRGVEGRLTETEQVLDNLPGSEIDQLSKLVNKKDTPLLQNQLQEMANRLMNPQNNNVEQGLVQPTKRARGPPTTRAGAGRRTNGLATEPPATVGRGGSKVSSKVHRSNIGGGKLGSKPASSKTIGRPPVNRKPPPSAVSSSTSGTPSIGGPDENEDVDIMEE